MSSKRARSESSSSSSDSDSDDDKRRKSSRKVQRRDRRPPAKEDRLDVDDHFYSKNLEFRHWLLHHRKKPKQFATLDAKKQRKYFKKFVKHWNKGKLPRGYYDGSILGGNANLPDSVDRPPNVDPPPYSAVQSAPRAGPSLPTLEDLTLQREAESDIAAARRDAERAHYKREQRESRQDERENRATGRDRIMEKRAEARMGAKEMAAAKEQGEITFGDDFLMGSSNSFQDAIRRRDAGRQNQQRAQRQLVKKTELDEKRTVHQQKEDNTMAMFKAMAAAKYGTGS